MAPTRQTAFRLPDDLMEALHGIKERDGIPLAEQVRRALATWVESRSREGGEKPQAARKRAATRKRA